ncbi:MAG: 16S rRNA (cytidine(1402)-2'-O)-methyltransferase [Pseudomonadota bacterium]
MIQGTLYIVATPIGNLEDITLRALRILKEVDLIAAEDTRQTRKLLSHYEIHTPLTSFFKGNEKNKSEKIIQELQSGKNIALVSDAGTPCISDPGYPLLEAAIQAEIKVEPIPGPSALTAALSGAGLPTNQVTFVGFLPDKPGKRRKEIEKLKDLPHTLVFYVSKWKIQAIVAECLEILGNRQACLGRELTKLHEEFIRGDLAELQAILGNNEPKGEMVLLIS